MTVAGRAAVRLRWIARLLACGALAAGTLVATAPAASALTCTYDTLGRTANVTIASGDSFPTIRANGPYLDVGDAFCALLSEVNTVTVNASAAPTVGLTFDLSGGPLGPGNFNEGNGSSEIEFSVTGLGPSSAIWVYGSAGNDHITVGWLNNKVTGFTAGQINLNAGLDGATPDNDISFAALPGKIYVRAGTGDDIISGAGTGTFSTGPMVVPLDLHGDSGSNTVTGGNAGDVVRYQQDFDPDGPDAVSGGLGADTVAPSTTGKNDTRTTASITLDGLANDGTSCPGTACNGDNIASDFEAVQGSIASEQITGNANPQNLSGGGGLDVVKGLGGSDTLGCFSGTSNGGAGNDTIVPFPSCGTARGGKGVDTASFAPYPNPPVVVTIDNVANDGQLGNDINIRSDVENLIGTVLNDTLSGSDRANSIDGGAGNDSLLGQGGNDTLIPGPGTDTAAGGPGTDRLSYAISTFAVVIDAVARAVIGQGDDTYTSIESYLGSPLADVMDGSSTNERFVGGAGNDDIFGAGGNDVLLGGEGDDTLDGGTGTDTCTQGPGTGPVVDCEA